jgi:hypothetical protein
MTNPRKSLHTAAALLGAKGGAAGKGASKRRDVDYVALGRKGAEARKKKKQKATEPPGAS